MPGSWMICLGGKEVEFQKEKEKKKKIFSQRISSSLSN